MKTTALTNKVQQGFTLIELIVVIAILGVLSVVLLVVIDPLDKINSANDTGYVSAITQIGRAVDAYAASHDNEVPAAATVDAALVILQGAGETKMAAHTQPATYTAPTYVTNTGCTDAANNCTQYAVTTGPLKSKKYGGPTTGQKFVWANGEGCFVANATVPLFSHNCP